MPAYPDHGLLGAALPRLGGSYPLLLAAAMKLAAFPAAAFGVFFVQVNVQLRPDELSRLREAAAVTTTLFAAALVLFAWSRSRAIAGFLAAARHGPPPPELSARALAEALSLPARFVPLELALVLPLLVLPTAGYVAFSCGLDGRSLGHLVIGALVAAIPVALLDFFLLTAGLVPVVELAARHAGSDQPRAVVRIPLGTRVVVGGSLLMGVVVLMLGTLAHARASGLHGGSPPQLVERMELEVLLICAVALAFSVALSVALARSLSRPLLTLSGFMRTADLGEGEIPRQLSADELGELSASFGAMLEKLRITGRGLEAARAREAEGYRLKSRFLANVSHELRTPLTAIAGFADLLLRGGCGPLTADQVRALTHVRNGSDQLQRLIDDLLDFSKLEAHRLVLRPRRVSLAAVVTEAAELVCGAATAKGLLLELRIDGPAEVSCDPLRLGQVLQNLLTNAVKFTRKGGVLVVARPRRDGGFELRVADSGVGIAARDRRVIFEEFRQLDASSTRGQGGTGLGLAIVLGLTSLMGGRLVLRSRPGTGTIFRLVLPGQPPAAAAPLAAVRTISPAA